MRAKQTPLQILIQNKRAVIGILKGVSTRTEQVQKYFEELEELKNKYPEEFI
jgi:hypothetical protein